MDTDQVTGRVSNGDRSRQEAAGPYKAWPAIEIGLSPLLGASVPIAITTIDIEFCGTAARHSQDQAAGRLSTAVASQLIIVFCAESVCRLALPAALQQPRKLWDMRHGSSNEIERVVTSGVIDSYPLLNIDGTEAT